VINLRLVTPDIVAAGQPLEVTASLTNLGHQVGPCGHGMPTIA
jgi:hypothetical protein